jgi:pyruvate kinase
MHLSPAPRTKIVATLGPASSAPEVIRRLVQAGMSVARLNFSHGSYDEHARAVEHVRAIAAELDTPVTIVQDLQGPKIRIGTLSGGPTSLVPGGELILLPAGEYRGQPHSAPIDYATLARDVARGAPVLLDDGRIELRVEQIAGTAVRCRVVEGGVLRDRTGVILPTVDVAMPSLTEKDRRDLDWGLAHGVDWIALSFVRRGEDVRALTALLAARGADVPVLAKIEKAQAVDNLHEIMAEVQGLMVARGDLGLELSPEKVPVLQKQIIRACNARGVPVITATQMLESMIAEPRPTRAEASDVANAIADGSDCVMLSGESAIGKYPVRAVEMMARIAREVEPTVQFTVRPPVTGDQTNALAQAIRAIDDTLALRCIAAFSTSGYTGRFVSAQRPRAPVVVLTPSLRAYHALNLLWGVRPLLTTEAVVSFEDLVACAERTLIAKGHAAPGDRILIVAGLPMSRPGGTNLMKIHVLGG